MDRTVIDQLNALGKTLQSEVRLQKSMGKSLGAISTILAASIDIGKKSSTVIESRQEQENIVISNGVNDETHLTNGYRSNSTG